MLDTYILFGDPATSLNVAPAEVSISKSVNPTGPLDPGDPITYTLSYSNTGPATAHHVVIQDDLPAELLNPTFDSSGVTVSQRQGTTFTWDVADLPAGQSGLITITATIDPQFVGVISNEASIQTSARELNTLNNTSLPISTIVEQPTSTLLTAFTGISQPGAILLEWETASEISVVGFNFYRSETENGTPVKITQNLIPAMSPGASNGNAYTFLDLNVVDGKTYYYWIEITTTIEPLFQRPHTCECPALSSFTSYYSLKARIPGGKISSGILCPSVGRNTDSASICVCWRSHIRVATVRNGDNLPS